ncbi:hypothetical protein HNQ92_000827 [Rhabdobacter roseus]|uniref:Uncharacterized protein n=1 Tax=Rhabdobacter roseus TaxID=1655419 RepID=A0A840TF14_9BACT|nr:hypothetical protein [Rhabdobacter roseus]
MFNGYFLGQIIICIQYLVHAHIQEFGQFL